MLTYLICRSVQNFFYQFKKLTLSLKMTTTQVVETSVTVNNSPI